MVRGDKSMYRGPGLGRSVVYLEPEKLDKRRVFESIRWPSRKPGLQDQCPREKERIFR